MKKRAISLALLFAAAIVAPSAAQDTTSALVSESLSVEDSALLARSQALSATDRERARSLFSTGFELWQQGVFPAAEIAFRDGLAIDPANAPANFYMGDIVRRRDRHAAMAYFSRAIAFGGSSAEAYRARAALEAARGAPATLDEMNADEIRQAFFGDWNVLFGGSTRSQAITLAPAADDEVTGTGRVGGGDNCRIVSGTVQGRDISLRLRCGSLWSVGATMRGTLVTPTRIEGQILWGTIAPTPWSATRADS